VNRAFYITTPPVRRRVALLRTGLHEIITAALIHRLERSGKYDDIRQHHAFSRNGLCGEMDVFAQRGGRSLYFEVKSGLSLRILRKTEYQAYRVITVFPDLAWRCWLVLPPDGHPATWLHEARPGLHVMRITPTCHHLHDLKDILRGRHRPSCSLCGAPMPANAQGSDREQRQLCERLLEYDEYLRRGSGA